jgi:hypothetical protein
MQYLNPDESSSLTKNRSPGKLQHHYERNAAMSTLPTRFSPVNAMRQSIRLPIWGGKAGGRHWRVLRSMIDRIPLGAEVPVLTISRSELGAMCNVSSHAGLERTIEFLIKHDLIAVLDRGTPDQHGDVRKRGRPATFLIRQRGASESASVHLLPPLPVVREEGYEGSPGVSPLPNADLDEDYFVEEPHLLRWLDMMDLAETVVVDVSASVLAKHLGLSMSGAWEMLQRWIKRGWVTAGRFWSSSVYGNTSKRRWIKLASAVLRARAIRAAALRGEYMPTRLRIHQRLQTTMLGRWRVLDYEAAADVENRQREKASMGLVPWLESSDYADVA